MKQQNYKNHIRWYVPHHFIFYPILLTGLFCSIYFVCSVEANALLWVAITFLLFLVLALSLLVRQHYGLGNQDRIVRLELRLRYYILTQKRFEEIESQLTFSQLAALRFAPDEEFIQLMQRALKENLSGDAIKRSIKNWLPDTMRL